MFALRGWQRHACLGSALLVGGAAVLFAGHAAAQSQFPERPFRLIVPQAPGSATDTLARLLSAELAPILGQSIVIENKPGAAFTIGLDLVAKSAPDGYTLGMGPVGALAISPNMIAKVPYNVERDFQPACLRPAGICSWRCRRARRSAPCRR